MHHLSLGALPTDNEVLRRHMHAAGATQAAPQLPQSIQIPPPTPHPAALTPSAIEASAASPGLTGEPLRELGRDPGRDPGREGGRRMLPDRPNSR